MFAAIHQSSNQVNSGEIPTRNLWNNRFFSTLQLGLAIVTCRKVDFTTSSLSVSQDSSELSRLESTQIQDHSIEDASGGYTVSIHPIEDGFW